MPDDLEVRLRPAVDPDRAETNTRRLIELVDSLLHIRANSDDLQARDAAVDVLEMLQAIATGVMELDSDRAERALIEGGVLDIDP